MRRNLFVWSLYDAANSFLLAAVSGLYLSQWVVIDNGFDDIWYGGTFTLATILLLLTSPFFGAWSDRLRKRKPFINWTTIILIISGFLLAFVVNSDYPIAFRVSLALVLFFLIQYVYQLSLIFYNTLLEKLSNPSNWGKISGLGNVAGSFGWIVGTAILLPFNEGKITLMGVPGRTQVFLPAVILFALLAWPMLLWFKEPPSEKREKVDFKAVYQKTIQGLKDLVRKNKNVGLFLLAFCFISDGKITAELFFAIVMEQVFRVPDPVKVQILGMMFLIAIPSAYLIGKLADKYGIKRILLLVCLDLIIIFALCFSASDPKILYFFAVFAGLAWGGFYTLFRALLIKISPKAQLGEYFGFYSTFERFASIVGPLSWGVITLMLRDYGILKYRVAGFALVFLMAIGTFLLTRVKEERVVA